MKDKRKDWKKWVHKMLDEQREKFQMKKEEQNPPLFFSVVSIDKTRFRKPSTSIVDESSLPKPAKSLVANDVLMTIQIRQ